MPDSSSDDPPDPGGRRTPRRGSGPRRAGRPPTIDRVALLDAAQELLDAGGAEALTMRRLARRLGVSPMALYRHVDGKDGLLLALIERLASRLPNPALPADPNARIVVLWGTLYDGLAEHPWLAGVTTRRRLMAPSVLGTIEEIHAALLAAGLTLEDAIIAYRLMWQFTLGALAVKAGTDRDATGTAADRPSVQQALRGSPDPARYPTLARGAAHWLDDYGHDTYRTDMQQLVNGLLSTAE